MDFLTLAKRRFSARKYSDTPVEEQKIARILELARVAPTAHNKQPLRLIVLRDGELRKRVDALYDREWLGEVPVLLVVCGDHGQSWKREDGKDHCDIDAGIAIAQMMLAATEIGLATCCVCNFAAAQCAAVLNLPPDLEPIAIVPLGYAAVEPDVSRHDAKRKKFEEMVYWDGFKG
ncbi:MAG: nitroreductase family protein [Deltaproteobacteria bacterium]|nr:nitroreductase family protein [Deltaproteobacteria bacterium]